VCQTGPRSGRRALRLSDCRGQAAPAFLSTAIAYRPPSTTSLSGRTSLAARRAETSSSSRGTSSGPSRRWCPAWDTCRCWARPTEDDGRPTALRGCRVRGHDSGHDHHVPDGARHRRGPRVQVTAAGQSSAILSGYSTSYAPPSSRRFRGPGRSLRTPMGTRLSPSQVRVRRVRPSVRAAPVQRSYFLCVQA